MQVPRIVASGPTPYGGAVATNMSQEQIDELASMPGTAFWKQEGTRLRLSIQRLEREGLLPLVLFDTTNADQYSALKGVLERGTLHICAAGGLRHGVLTGGKIAFTVPSKDRTVIATALGSVGGGSIS